MAALDQRVAKRPDDRLDPTVTRWWNGNPRGATIATFSRRRALAAGTADMRVGDTTDQLSYSRTITARCDCGSGVGGLPPGLR